MALEEEMAKDQTQEHPHLRVSKERNNSKNMCERSASLEGNQQKATSLIFLPEHQHDQTSHLSLTFLLSGVLSTRQLIALECEVLHQWL